MHIEALGVSHTYDIGTPLSSEALRKVSLTVSSGERVGVLGPTGSGKSTLAQILAGLLVPTGGEIRYDGSTVERRARRRLRKHIGFALQYPEDQIFERTVFREVAFGPRKLGLGEAEIRKRAHWALERVGLSPEAFAERSPFTLSGGEMRRVALASILSLRPQVLILDEPTAGLDPRGRQELLELILQLYEELEPTLIVISHDLDGIARLVDRGVVLSKGRLVTDGPIRSVLSDRRLPDHAGLAAPASGVRLPELRSAGWPVRTDRVLPEEAAAEIYGAWQTLEHRR